MALLPSDLKLPASAEFPCFVRLRSRRARAVQSSSSSSSQKRKKKSTGSIASGQTEIIIDGSRDKIKVGDFDLEIDLERPKVGRFRAPGTGKPSCGVRETRMATTAVLETCPA